MILEKEQQKHVVIFMQSKKRTTEAKLQELKMEEERSKAFHKPSSYGEPIQVSSSDMELQHLPSLLETPAGESGLIGLDRQQEW